MLWESAQEAWHPRTRAGKGTLASLGILVTTVCLEEMGETERRETKGKQENLDSLVVQGRME